MEIRNGRSSRPGAHGPRFVVPPGRPKVESET
jgi:hypothetical protein